MEDGLEKADMGFTLKPATLAKPRVIKMPRGKEGTRSDSLFNREISTVSGHSLLKSKSNSTLNGSKAVDYIEDKPRRRAPLVPRGYVFAGKLRL